MPITQEILDDLFEAQIDDFKLDMLQNTLTIDVTILENGLKRHRTIVFKNIATMYYINNSTEQRSNMINLDKDDYIELTSIYLLEDLIKYQIVTDSETWLTQYEGGGNLALELWSKVLVLEVDELIIDNVSYNITCIAK